jgi:alanine dehydrogenase
VGVVCAEHTITSNEALELESLPKQVAIIGSGFIACEFAGIFHGSGSDVTIVRPPTHLPFLSALTLLTVIYRTHRTHTARTARTTYRTHRTHCVR